MTAEIPDGWHVSTLSEICDKITDGTHYTPSYVSHGVPFYSVESVTRDDFINVKFITPDAHRILARRCRPRRGDILMTRIGSLADTKLIDWDVDASIYVSLALLHPSRSVDSTYLYAYTKSRTFVQDVEDRSLLWAVPKKINMGDIGLIPVMVPDLLAEQRAIGALLGDVESETRALRRLLAKKRAIKQGMMQELMTGRTRLSGYTGLWRRVLFSDIVTPVSERVDPGRAIGRVVELEHLSQSTGELAGYSDVRSTESLKTSFHSGDVLFGKLRAYLRKFWLADFDGFCSTEIWALRPIPKVSDGAFIRYVVEEDAFIEAASTSYGTHMPRSDWRVVSKFELDLPPLDEQRAIAQVLRDADAEIEALEKRLEATRQIKEGMMQELLTGRTRLV